MRITIEGSYEEQIRFGHELALLTLPGHGTGTVKSVKATYSPCKGHALSNTTEFEVEFCESTL